MPPQVCSTCLVIFCTTSDLEATISGREATIRLFWDPFSYGLEGGGEASGRGGACSGGNFTWAAYSVLGLEERPGREGECWEGLPACLPGRRFLSGSGNFTLWDSAWRVCFSGWVTCVTLQSWQHCCSISGRDGHSLTLGGADCTTILGFWDSWEGGISGISLPGWEVHSLHSHASTWEIFLGVLTCHLPPFWEEGREMPAPFSFLPGREKRNASTFRYLPGALLGGPGRCLLPA